jgi:endonuclease/exonuclease/phosphatase family metal-dependent hydrolase
MCWNAHSVRNKITELNLFLENKDIDIALISETWFETKDCYNFNNYSLYRADRDRGGVAILIKSSISHSSVSSIKLDYAESVSLVIHLNNEEINLTSIYISPAASRLQSKTFFSRIFNKPGQHVVAGDFNCKHTAWNNVNRDHKGIDLYDLSSSRNYNVLVPDAPTHIPYVGDVSTIDIVFHKSNLPFSNPVTINDLSSDHLPVCFSILNNHDGGSDVAGLNLRKANWKKFKNFVNFDVSREIFSNSTVDDIDVSIAKLSSIIESSMHSCIPKRRVVRNRYMYSDKVKNLISHRNQFRSLYQSTYDQSYKSCVNQLNRMIRKEIQEEKKSQWNDKLNSLSYRDNSLFEFTKSVKKKNQLIPPLKDNNDIAYSSHNKAELIAETFLDIHNVSANSTSKHESTVRDSIQNINSSPSGEFDNIDENQVSQVLNSLNVKKASGPDLIPNAALKALSNSEHFVSKLTSIFNGCLSLSYFPKSWKIAKIIPIPKTKPASTIPNDYRPISLLSTMGKVFERLILDRLNDFEELNSIIIDQQFGFQSNHSTVQQVLRITEKASLGFNRNKSLGMVMLDLRKAYDSVWHDALVHKLRKLGYPMYLIKLINSYLRDRLAFVTVDGANSSKFLIPAGVPQGSIIAPHLFNVFINDIPIPRKGELALFADDTTYFIEAPWKNLKIIKNHLIKALQSFQNFFHEWKIFLNDSKTEFIVFTRSTKMIQKCQDDVIKFNSLEFRWKSQVKYLGIILDTKLTYKSHVDWILRKAKSVAFSQLYCLLKRNSGVTVDSKLRIYKSIIRPVVSYGCSIFINCAASHLNKIQVFQNKVLRYVLDINWDDFVSNVEVHGRANIPFMAEFFNKLTVNFYRRIDSHKNSLINHLGQYDYSHLEFRLKHKLPRPVTIQ